MGGTRRGAMARYAPIAGGAALAGALIVGSARAEAQAPPAAQTIPVRNAVPLARTDSGVFRFIGHVRALSNGSVIVNDIALRRVTMLDSTLQRRTILADTTTGARNNYGAQGAALVRYTGDSTLFVDRTAQALIVIDPEGRFTRVTAPPIASDINFLFTQNPAETGVDAESNLVYRSVRRMPPMPPSPPDPSGRPVPRPVADSAPVIRARFDTRAVDTVALIKIAAARPVVVPMGPGQWMQVAAMNPLPLTDDWALMHDGTVAIVRAADYHVDWVHPDGRMTSTPRMPFDWRRITHEQKVALLDSVRTAGQAMRDRERELLMARAGAGGGAATTEMLAREMSIPFTVVAPEEMSDYYPPVRAGTTRADPNGNLWVLPSTTVHAGEGLVYDVVNRAGEIVERVRLPQGRNLLAIGADGSLFLVHAPSPSRIALERARVER